MPRQRRIEHYGPVLSQGDCLNEFISTRLTAMISSSKGPSCSYLRACVLALLYRISMSWLSRILTLALVFSLAVQVNAVSPAHNYSDKTVAQLLNLLESKDDSVRECAAMFLGYRYVTNQIILDTGIKSNIPAPELPVPSQVLPRLAKHLTSDPNPEVRICVVLALCDLRCRTNTTSILLTGLEDKDVVVRIRTCSAFIGFLQAYSEALPEKVIPTLIQCLNPQEKEDDIWQAASAAGGLGTNGIALVPALKKLMDHDSSKVRYYAERALSTIKPSSGSSSGSPIVK